MKTRIWTLILGMNYGRSNCSLCKAMKYMMGFEERKEMVELVFSGN